MKAQILTLLWLVTCGFTEAEEFSVLSYGTANPGYCEASPSYCRILKGAAPAVSVKWEFKDQEAESGWVSRLNSFPGTSDKDLYFAATGWRKEWPVTEQLAGSVTFLTGYLNGPSKSEMMALPLFSLGSRETNLEVGFLPGLNLMEMHFNSRNVSMAMSWIPNINAGPDKSKTSITTFSLRGAF